MVKQFINRNKTWRSAGRVPVNVGLVNPGLSPSAAGLREDNSNTAGRLFPVPQQKPV